MTTTPRDKILALAEKLEGVSGITAGHAYALQNVISELRTLASTLPATPATDNGKGLRDALGDIFRRATDGANDGSDAHEVLTFAWERIVAEVLATNPPQQERAWRTTMAVDDLANVIRIVDGSHSLGAGELAEKIIAYINAAAPAAPATPESEQSIKADCYDMIAEAVEKSGTRVNSIVEYVGQLIARNEVSAESVAESFADWLAREMPPGTVIGDPRWWAPKIERMYRVTHPTPAASDNDNLERFELRLTKGGDGGEMVVCENGGWVRYSDTRASDGDAWREAVIDELALTHIDCNGSPPPAAAGVVVDGVECHGLDTPDMVRFYEHDFYVLSNFSAFTILWEVSKREGLRRFDTSEAVYHWMKFKANVPTMIQYRIMEEIRLAASAHEAFKIAERNRDHRRPDWDAVKFDVMREILRAKADQHEYVRRKLLATGNRLLVEDSWRDDVWGWGPNRDGQNMLGKLWMEIRAELRAALAGQQKEGGR